LVVSGLGSQAVDTQGLVEAVLAGWA